jgi:hypothetical protein
VPIQNGLVSWRDEAVAAASIECQLGRLASPTARPPGHGLKPLSHSYTCITALM